MCVGGACCSVLSGEGGGAVPGASLERPFLPESTLGCVFSANPVLVRGEAGTAVCICPNTNWATWVHFVLFLIVVSDDSRLGAGGK